MEQRNAIRVGTIGAVLAAMVCFTPLVVTILGVLGLSSWFGWIDSAFHIVLVLSVGLAIYGLYRRRQGRKAQVSVG